MQKTSEGFSLLELLTVVTIVGIISAVAYPSYTQYSQKGKRAEAKTRMLQIAQLEERYFTENNSYTTNAAALLGISGTVYSSDTNSTTSGYQLTVAAGTATGQTIANSFVITASPQLTQTNDTKCGTLTVTHTGAKSTSGTGSLSDCWN